MAKLSWKQAFINAVDAYRKAKGTTDKIAVGNFPALLEEAIAGGGGATGGGSGEYNTLIAYPDEIPERYYQDNQQLVKIRAENVASIGQRAFDGCTALTTVDLPNVASIGELAFANCQSLKALILRTTETVCVIDLTAFNNCNFLFNPSTGTNNGHIYVPAVMYEYYRAGYEAPLADRLGEGAFDRIVRKIEDYPEICG